MREWGLIALILICSSSIWAQGTINATTIPSTSTPPQPQTVNRQLTAAKRATIAAETSSSPAITTGPTAELLDPCDRPAVAYVNGWIGGSFGDWHSAHLHNGYLAIADGGVTIPLFHRVGAQIDGYNGVVSHHNLFATDAYLFWRDPCLGLAAFHYDYTNINHIYANLYSLRGDWYLYNWILSLEGGSMHTNVHGGSWYGEIFANWYPRDNWLIDLGFENFAGNYAVQGGTEYLFTWGNLPGISAYADAGGGNHETRYAWIGLRFYLGCDKTLIRRHREDTVRPLFTLNDVNRRKHH